MKVVLLTGMVVFFIGAMVWVGFGSYLLVKDKFSGFPLAFQIILPIAAVVVFALMVASVRVIYRDWKRGLIEKTGR